jgi:SAM-dependent methyltransferase
MTEFDAGYMARANKYAAQPFWLYEVGHLVDRMRARIAGGDVLDVGCNDGALLSAVLGLLQPRTVCGVDVNVDAVQHARLVRPLANCVAVFPDDPLPFMEGAFDTVLCMHTLGHVDDPVRAVCEMFRVTRRGGAVSVIVPNRSYYAVHDFGRSGARGDPTQRHEWAPLDLSELFADMGWTIARVSTFGRSPPLMPWLRSRILLEGHKP